MILTPTITPTLTAILDGVHDGAYLVDPDRRITFWNTGAEEITGYARSQVVGRRCQDNLLRHVDDAGTELCRTACPLAATLVDGVPRRTVVYLHHRDGHRLPVEVRVGPIRDEAGAIVGAVELFTDVSARVHLMNRLQELEELALLDPLTRLPNRRYLEQELDHRLAEMARFNARSGLLFLDVDDFKRINDTHGHLAGDAVLRTLAATLAANLRPFDTVGRWGGEEFLALVRQVDGDGLRRVAEKLRVLAAASRAPAGGKEIGVTVSLGATLLRPGDTGATVLQRADTLLYQAKAAGKNRVAADTAP